MSHLPITKNYLETQFRNFNDNFLINEYIKQDRLRVKNLSTPTVGMLSSYQIVFEDSEGIEHPLGSTIDIPKDFLVKNVTVKICEENDIPVKGYIVGDKYIDFTINAKDDSEIETHLYIACKDLIQLQASDGIKIINNNEINVLYGEGLRINDGSTVTADEGKLEVDYNVLDAKYSHITYVNFRYTLTDPTNLVTSNGDNLITADNYYLVAEYGDNSYTPDKTYDEIKYLAKQPQQIIMGFIYDVNDELIDTTCFIGDTFFTTTIDNNIVKLISYVYNSDLGIWEKRDFSQDNATNYNTLDNKPIINLVGNTAPIIIADNLDGVYSVLGNYKISLNDATSRATSSNILFIVKHDNNFTYIKEIKDNLITDYIDDGQNLSSHDYLTDLNLYDIEQDVIEEIQDQLDDIVDNKITEWYNNNQATDQDAKDIFGM